MNDPLSEELLACGLVDTHYHVGPEFLNRRYDVSSLAEAAKRHDITLVLKNHTYPTTPLASLARERFGVRFLGSVVLNRYVGGLNPDAVYGAASGNRSKVSDVSIDPSFVVYMPTVHAASHLRVLGHAFDTRWSCGHTMDAHANDSGEPVQVFDTEGEPAPTLREVLKAIAETNSVLATGHLSAMEIMKLVPMALDLGVPRILLTHPHYPSVELSDEQLIDLTSDPRVFIEHCLAIHTIEKVPLSRFANSIRATGTAQVVLATDFGQIHSEPIPEGTLSFARNLSRELGDSVDREKFLAMFSTNGARALGLNGS